MLFLHLLELLRLLLVVLKDTDAAFEYDIEGVTVIILIHHEVTLLLTFNPAVLHYLRVKVSIFYHLYQEKKARLPNLIYTFMNS